MGLSANYYKFKVSDCSGRKKDCFPCFVNVTARRLYFKKGLKETGWYNQA